MSLDDVVIWALLLFGLFLFLYDIKLMVAPQRKGRVVAVEDQLEEAQRACSCNSARMGKSYVRARVRLEDGGMVDVEVSPCLFCMDKVTIGSQIGVNSIGKRLIARRYIDLLGRGLANDDVPLPKPEEAYACPTQGVAE